MGALGPFVTILCILEPPQQLIRPEDLGPLVEGQVGGDQDGPALAALAEELEEQFRPDGGQGAEAQFVDDQQVESDSCRCRLKGGFGSCREAIAEVFKEGVATADDFMSEVLSKAYQALTNSTDPAVKYFVETLTVLSKQPRDYVPCVEWLGQYDRQIRRRIQGALRVDLSPSEIMEIFVHVMLYGGYFTARTAMRIACSVFTEQGIMPRQ